MIRNLISNNSNDDNNEFGILFLFLFSLCYRQTDDAQEIGK